MAEPSTQNVSDRRPAWPDRLALCAFLLIVLALWAFAGPHLGRPAGRQHWIAVEVVESLFLVCPLLAIIPYLVATTLRDERARPAARFIAVCADVIFVVLVWLLAPQLWGCVAWLYRA